MTPAPSTSTTAGEPSIAAVVVTFNRKVLLVECLRALLAQTRPLQRILVVDNASTDGTRALAEDICQGDARWRYLRFSRDFGVETSMLAGLRASRGDATVVLFSDLQDPPELIGTMSLADFFCFLCNQKRPFNRFQNTRS